MRVLIDTIPFDEHAAAIRWLLEQRGHSVDFLFRSDFPASQSISLRAGKDGCEAWAPAVSAAPLRGYDAGVMRRHRGPTISSNVADIDGLFALRQARIVDASLNAFIDTSGWWVNPVAGAGTYGSKPHQLKCAVDVGFDVPETLISNDSAAILEFVKDAPGEVISKPLQPAAWNTAEQTRLTFTAKVSEALVAEHAESLALTPAIFQHYVAKAAEVRAVFMGRTCYAVEVASGTSEEVTDWRLCYTDGRGLRLRPVKLPAEVHDRALAFMDRIGLVFGSFDFCIDHDGRYMFLEVNPMGQFLWLEKEPSVPSLLSAFCDFLESGDPDFEAGPAPRDAFRFSDARVTARFAEIFAAYDDHRAENNGCFTYSDDDRSADLQEARSVMA